MGLRILYVGCCDQRLSNSWEEESDLCIQDSAHGVSEW